MNLGQRFARFTVFGQIGVGGMSTVYAGFDGRSMDLVALKTLRQGLAEGGPHLVARLQREAEIYARLSHPNIVSYVEAGEAGGVPYIALELVRGRSLAAVIREERTSVLSFDRVVNIVKDAAAALGCAHASQVIHRDIKPSNIILTQDDTVKVIDFGIASLGDADTLTGEGTIIGTVTYAPPEQNEGRALDQRADLYALGCVLFEMLTGQRALPGETLAEVAQFQKLPSLALPSHFNRDVPPELDRVTNRLLAPRREDRYQTADELVADLLEVKRAGRTAEGRAHAVVDEVAETWEAAKDAWLRGALDDALGFATAYCQQRPQDARAHFLLGKLYARQGKPFNATESFGRALHIAPGNADYHVDFALALLGLEMHHQALDECQRLLERDPRNVKAQGLKLLAAEGHKRRLAYEEAETAAAAVAKGHAPPAFRAEEGLAELARKTGPLRADQMAQAHAAYAAQQAQAVQARRDEATVVRDRRPVVDVRTARRARFCSTLFPGLGDLYCGRVGVAFQNVVMGVAYLALAVAVFAYTSQGRDLLESAYARWPELLASVKPVVDAGSELGLDELVNRWPVATPFLAWLPVLLFIVHWIDCRHGAYTSVLKVVLAGTVLEAMADGRLRLDRGAGQGVEPGLLFIVKKGTQASRISALDSEPSKTLLGYRPIGVARVVAAEADECVATFRPVAGVSARPARGDAIEPQW